MLNLEKHYNAARKMVGDSGPDLVHHCYILVHAKLEGVQYPDTYFHRTMINQLSKKDSWRRQEAMIHPKTTMCRIEGVGNRQAINSQWWENRIDATGPIAEALKVEAVQDPDEWSQLNTLKVENILEDLRTDGHGEEVSVFMSKASGQSVSEISRKTGVCRETLYECIEFVKSTVKERYSND